MSFPAEHTEPNSSCHRVPALLAAFHRAHPHQITLSATCPKRHYLVLQLMNRMYLGAQPQESISRWAQADTCVGHTWECSWSLPLRGWGQVFLSTTPSSHRAFRAFMAKSVSIDCVALQQSNTMDCKWQGTGLSQHTCKVSRGYHTAGSVTPCENRLARQVELFL